MRSTSALRGLPEDRIRYHICWGSWHGPHTTDIPLARYRGPRVERQMRAPIRWKPATSATSTNGASGRMSKLPDGKLLIPGVVGHATNIVEHPQVVADRIMRYAKVVGRENVIAGTDCGLGGRVHPQIAWAKLEALSEGRSSPHANLGVRA